MKSNRQDQWNEELIFFFKEHGIDRPLVRLTKWEDTNRP